MSVGWLFSPFVAFPFPNLIYKESGYVITRPTSSNFDWLEKVDFHQISLDQQTDQPTDRQTDRQTDPLIEMREGIFISPLQFNKYL